jgi:regulatory protein CII
VPEYNKEAMKRKPHYFQYLSNQEEREITDLLQTAMDGNAKSIAFSIGCSYQDMVNRVANQPRSPRKLEMVIRILELVKNPEPFLRWLCLRFGFIPVQLPELTMEVLPLHKQMTRVSKELGDASRELMAADEDDFIDRRERMKTKKENMDIIQAVLGLDLAIEQKYKSKEKHHV